VMRARWVYVGAALVALAVIGGVVTQPRGMQETLTSHTQGVELRTAPWITVTTTALDGGEVRYVVSPDEIVSGGPPKDGIPSIDSPRFIRADEADFLRGEELVVGIFYRGVSKAYPHRILVWHEIVNDVVADEPISVTYCPLCYTATAYRRVLGGNVTTFGVSGKLYNSDMVMYDRLTDTYWSQHLGIGIYGPLAGVALERVQVYVMTWSKWRELHPDTLVLSTETGFSRPYGRDPYSPYGYYRSRDIWFPVKNLDDRLHPKAIVHGVVIDGVAKVYEQRSIARVKVLNDEVAGQPVVIVSPLEQYAMAYSRKLGENLLEFTWEDGRLVDTQTRSLWNMDGEAVSGPLKGGKLSPIVVYPAFWFAWSAFYPGVELYYDGGDPAFQ
jgi:hypothetical protein